MKRVLILCILAAVCCVPAFAALTTPAADIPAELSFSNVIPAEIVARQNTLTAEMEAIAAELEAAKLSGADQTDLFARLREIRRELGMKESRDLDRGLTPSFDEGGESCTSATVIGALPYIDAGNTCDNADDDSPTCGTPNPSNPTPDVFYSFTPTLTVEVTVTTCLPATDFDTILKIYDSAGNLVACNDDTFGDDACQMPNGAFWRSTIECVRLFAGERYCIVVDGFTWDPNSDNGAFRCGNYEMMVTPCSVPCGECTDADRLEGEPVCEDGYIDLFNSGCNAVYEHGQEYPLFQRIFCGETICGTVGTFTTNEQNFRDTDWYLLTVTEPTRIRWCAVGQFDEPQMAILDVSEGCDFLGVIVNEIVGDFCERGCVEACVGPGLYALFISTPQLVQVPCGTPYRATVECLPCDPPPNCIPEPAFLPIPVNQVDLPYCECLFLCPGVPTLICVGPGLASDEVPVMNLTLGCSPNNTDCDVDCQPAVPPLVGTWFYDPDNGAFYIRMIIPPGAGPGCVCLCLEDILPVELNGFDAIAGDGEVTLSWSTASETNMDHFDVLRDGTTVARLDASNNPSGGSYTWNDGSLTNGRTYTYSLMAVEVGGAMQEVGTIEATPSASAATITEYALHQNFPNPFNPETRITFDLVDAGFAKLTVYNSLGQTVTTLANGELSAGRHTVAFDAADLPSGLYFYRLEAGDFTAIKKMVLMK